MEKHIESLEKLIHENKDVCYIIEPNPEIRKEFHIYMKNRFNTQYQQYIARTEYLAHGAKMRCCNKWYKSSEYGNSWNGGTIFCDVCGNISFLEFDDYEDIMDNVKLSDYRPTDKIMICKAGYSYKTSYNMPFSYRKHY